MACELVILTFIFNSDKDIAFLRRNLGDLVGKEDSTRVACLCKLLEYWF
jgi:hypothetical protein